MTPQLLFLLAPGGAILALFFAILFYTTMKKAPEGTDRMKEIASYIREGSKAYLKQQYRLIAIFFAGAVVLFLILAFVAKVQSIWASLAFLSGGFFSGLAGFIGMKTATYASGRTANAAINSLNSALQIAFRAGAVMGLVVAGLGLLDISIKFLFFRWVMNSEITGIWAVNNLEEVATIMLASGMGASLQALFARVGGGIFTKAADVGADLVGKVESSIPEDDPRNPATIADNVGDNVGDVAGMGADLYESYCGSILATIALGGAAFLGSNITLNGLVLPMAIAGIGIICSIVGIYFVKSDEQASQKNLLGALSRGINVSSILFLILSAGVVYLLLPGHFNLFGAIFFGLLAGILIGKATEYFTSSDFQPTRTIAKQSLTGPATVVIYGMSAGMISTILPAVVLCAAIFLSYTFGSRFDFANFELGLYGVGVAAVSMLSTLGITLATDAYGPIADNAGGNAEMSGLGEEVRARTDALDSLGNTTAATGKGFAIGSAALTSLALLTTYLEEVRIGLEKIGIQTLEFAGREIEVATATLHDFMAYYDVTLINPRVLIGLIMGSMISFAFCAMTMRSVGKAAGEMVDEVRRQFKERLGILKGTEKPDYAACVMISTKAAQREMIVPSVMALVVPVIIGLLLGVAGVMGLLAGTLSTGFILALTLDNAGGAWDNAKKYIESGEFGGKGSEAHKATVIGDTIGDPFKDTSGPSLNILIKLISMVSVVMAGLVVKWGLF